MAILYIYAENVELRNYLQEQVHNHRWTDSGFDIPMLSGSLDVPNGTRNASIPLGVRVAAVDPLADHTRPCLLLPRSSIGKTAFRLTNSIGLIDQGYRGEVQAKVDVVEPPTPWVNGTRMFQLCQHNFMPWTGVFIVDSLEDLPTAPDNRGEGGFGSTG